MLTLYVKVAGGVWFGVAYENEHVFATAFAPNRSQTLQSLLRNIPFNIPFQHSEKPIEFAEKVVSSLAGIYNGKGCIEKFSLVMDWLSGYTQKVLGAVPLIPVGYVTTYSSLAKAVGGSPRAVGRVMVLNPFPLLIPCHRVVASDFSIGGYSYGVHVKLEILRRERRGYRKAENIKVNSHVLRIFPVEFVQSL